MFAPGGQRRSGQRAVVGATLFGAVSLLALGACGPPEVPPAAPLPKPSAPPPKVLIEPDTPLVVPEDALLVGRWRAPAELLEKLGPLLNGDRALESALRARIGQPHHPVDLQQPIELLVVLDRQVSPPELAWAVSFGLDAEKAAEKPPALALGPVDVASPIGLRCAEARSLGSASLRMVCAATDEQLAKLLAPVTRALPLVALGKADFALSVRTQSLRSIDERALHALVSARLSEALGVPSMNARFDAQFAGVVAALVRELRDVSADLDAAFLEVELQPHAQGLDFSLAAPAAPRQSALAQVVVGSGASGLAPADFWYAHAVSEEAGFIWTFESAVLERWRVPLAELLSTALDFRGVPIRLARQARYLVESLPVPRGPIVYASGQSPPPDIRATKRGSVEASGSSDPSRWEMIVARGSFAEYQYYVSELVKAFNDPILGPQFGRLLRGAWGPRAAPTRLKQRRLAAPSRLSKGSFTLEISLPGRAEAESGSVDERGRDAQRSGEERSWFVLMSPDDDGVKIVWGEDEKFLASLLADPERMKATSTLASRPGLGALHEKRTLAGGFYSLASLFGADSPWAAALGLEKGAASSLGSAPHRGLSPIVYRLSQPSEDAPLQLSADLDRETLEDLLFWLSAASRDVD